MVRIELLCGVCYRERDHHRALTWVNTTTGDPLTDTTVEYNLSDERQWDAPPARFAARSRKDLLARRTEADDGWYLDCHPKRCGVTYKVTDGEMTQAVKLASDRKPPHVYVPHEVGTPVE